MPATAFHPSDAVARDASVPESHLLSSAERLRTQLVTARELIRRPTTSDSLGPRSLPTRLTAVDRLLAGGLARGRLVELTGRRSSGRFSIVLAALAAATSAEEAAVLIDLGNGLDPESARAAGVTLERLLWVRPDHLKQALIGAEMSLNAGFPLVILDLGNPPVPGGRGGEASWLRLARAAAAHEAALLVSTPYRASGTAAGTVLETAAERILWQGRGRSPRLLAGLYPRLCLHKLDGRPVHRTGDLRLTTQAGLIEARVPVGEGLAPSHDTAGSSPANAAPRARAAPG